MILLNYIIKYFYFLFVFIDLEKINDSFAKVFIRFIHLIFNIFKLKTLKIFIYVSYF